MDPSYVSFVVFDEDDVSRGYRYRVKLFLSCGIEKPFVLKWGPYSNAFAQAQLVLLHITEYGPERVGVNPLQYAKPDKDTILVNGWNQFLWALPLGSEIKRRGKLTANYYRRLIPGEKYELLWLGAEISMWDWESMSDHVGQELESRQVRESTSPRLILSRSRVIAFPAKQEPEPWLGRPDTKTEAQFQRANKMKEHWRREGYCRRNPPLSPMEPSERLPEDVIDLTIKVTYEGSAEGGSSRPITFHTAAFLTGEGKREGIRLYRHKDGSWERSDPDDGFGTGFEIFDDPPILVNVGESGEYSDRFIDAASHRQQRWRILTMAPSRSDRDWDALDGDVDTIDLTFSSPEPEPRSLPLPRQQHLNPSYFKREPQPDAMSHIKRERNHPGGITSNNPRAQQGRQINPHHIAQIINTSDTNALRKILLDLCKISPALSGAVARGLAPHSTFAQATINQHRVRPQPPDTNPRIKPDPELVRPFASNSRPRSAVPAIERLSARPSARPSASPSIYPSAPRIKFERTASPADDSDASSIIVDFPGSYPRSPQPSSGNRAPPREGLSGPTNLSISRRLASIQGEPEAASKSCMRCHRRLEGNSGNCRWHSGSEVSVGSGRPSFSCCRRPFDSAGCMTGPHVERSDPIQRSPLKRTHPNTPAVTFGSQSLKKPRVL
ncbi:hypothetical protein P153DRAFT_360575 [Dothidotthia symphoricarpi CBS 119687]|uniref:Uncharacterized protein n=1 Tax=Dothidotthia symphoricarpi CBS 119687 TaxID=1392245 RepID=A0A6A5ZZD3_9PLEO|nr:uncharacterized protein P153DRAFT_360575 [Dothidotthia symphoricarpi CBS 119687]KAF2124929.1 hypothetical protein P153DRAFT_360575 [Dothidotthia symphoricarpi CBS 119687]